jgi:Leucine-rich repeat (LRR) protein
LKEIDLQNNLLTGNAFPTSLPTDSVAHYKVSGNRLTGTIPTSILTKWTQLQTLWAGNNQISGTIPTQFGRLNRLTSLYLYENRMVGSVPSQLGNILLQEIWLSNNFFAEQIPESLLFLGSLKLFRLENNVFSGSLATWIGLLTNLQDLRVNNNNIDGTVPVQLDQLTDLSEYFMSKH